MTQSKFESRDDSFSLWYRFRAVMVFNLLQLGGPAHLQQHNDPRAEVEQDYLRRRAMHRERRGKLPLVQKPKSSGTGMLGVVLPILGGVVAVAVLIVWAVLSAH